MSTLGRRFPYNKDVLIPRQCTEEYKEALAEVIRRAPVFKCHRQAMGIADSRPLQGLHPTDAGAHAGTSFHRIGRQRRRYLNTALDLAIHYPASIATLSFQCKTSSQGLRRCLMVTPPACGSAPRGCIIPPIIAIAQRAKTRLLPMEVAGTEQALKVARLAADSHEGAVVRIWRGAGAFRSGG